MLLTGEKNDNRLEQGRSHETSTSIVSIKRSVMQHLERNASGTGKKREREREGEREKEREKERKRERKRE
jgi:hypothetical protein